MMHDAAVIARLKRRPLLAALVVVLLGGCSVITQRPAHNRPQGRSSATTAIYVARRGWHIDVGFEASELEPPLASLEVQFASLRYLSFGFGDRHYLVARNKNFPGLAAAIWPGPGLLLATGLTAPPEEAFGPTQVIRLSVSPEAARAAQAYIWASLASENGIATPYANGPYQGSQYYSATQRYSGFYTCNTWAAEVLHAAGLPIHSVGVLFAGQLWAQVTKIAHDTADRATPRAAAPLPDPMTIVSQR
jgi:hypothetical protein